MLDIKCSECGAVISLNLVSLKFGVAISDWLKCPRYTPGEHLTCKRMMAEGAAALQEAIQDQR